MTFQIHKRKSGKIFYKITDGSKMTYVNETTLRCVREFQSTGLKNLFKSLYNIEETTNIEFETIDELINLIPEEFL